MLLHETSQTWSRIIQLTHICRYPALHHAGFANPWKWKAQSCKTDLQKKNA